MVRSRLVPIASAALMISLGGSTATTAIDTSRDASSRQGERLRPTIPENDTFTGRLVNALPAEGGGCRMASATTGPADPAQCFGGQRPPPCAVPRRAGSD